MCIISVFMQCGISVSNDKKQPLRKKLIGFLIFTSLKTAKGTSNTEGNCRGLDGVFKNNSIDKIHMSTFILSDNLNLKSISFFHSHLHGLVLNFQMIIIAFLYKNMQILYYYLKKFKVQVCRYLVSLFSLMIT